MHFALNRAQCYLSLWASKLTALFQYETTFDEKGVRDFWPCCHSLNEKFALPPTVNYASHITSHASREISPRGHNILSLCGGTMQQSFAAAQLRHIPRMQECGVAVSTSQNNYSFPGTITKRS